MVQLFECCLGGCFKTLGVGGVGGRGGGASFLNDFKPYLVVLTLGGVSAVSSFLNI